MSQREEQLDRRAFLRGMMLTSAGLLIAKPATIFVPQTSLALDNFQEQSKSLLEISGAFVGPGMRKMLAAKGYRLESVIHDSYIFVATSRTSVEHPNLSNFPKA